MENKMLQINGFNLDFILDYFRMSCYALVILTDLRNIVHRKFSNLLYVGDVIIAFALMLSAFNMGQRTLFDTFIIADVILTPAAFLWAIIHFYEFIKKN